MQEALSKSKNSGNANGQVSSHKSPNGFATSAQAQMMPAFALGQNGPNVSLLSGTVQAKHASPAGLANIAQRQEMEEKKEPVQTPIMQSPATGKEEKPEETTVQNMPVQRQTEKEKFEEEKVQPQLIQQKSMAEEEPKQETIQPNFIQRQAEKEGEELPSSSTQTKLTIGAPNNQYEREADSVADRGMRMPESATPEEEQETLQAKPIIGSITQLGSQIQAKCAECEPEDRIQTKTNFPAIPDLEKVTPAVVSEPETGSAKQEKAPEDKDADKAKKKRDDAKVSEPAIEPYTPDKEAPPPVQTKSLAASSNQHSNSAAGQRQNGAALQDALHNSKGGGSPMAPPVQAEMEQHFGRDLSQVRVHTDSTAIQMNRALSARAFTNEKDVYFNAGEYSPTSPSGKYLL